MRNLYSKNLMSDNTNSDSDRQIPEVEIDRDRPFASFFSDRTDAFIQARQWFDSLPPVGRLAVAIAAVTVAFSLLSFVWHLVTALLSIALSAVILYVVYKFLTAASSTKQE
jgi:hypothetical protein